MFETANTECSQNKYTGGQIAIIIMREHVVTYSSEAVADSLKNSGGAIAPPCPPRNPPLLRGSMVVLRFS